MSKQGSVTAATHREVRRENARLIDALKDAQTDNLNLRRNRNELRKRVEVLEKVRVAVLKHRDNKEFLNIDTWNACVYVAEAATEQEKE